MTGAGARETRVSSVVKWLPPAPNTSSTTGSKSSGPEVTVVIGMVLVAAALQPAPFTTLEFKRTVPLEPAEKVIDLAEALPEIVPPESVHA